MINFIVVLVLSTFAPTSVQTAQVQTCVWPNPCGGKVVVAQVETCIWPRCSVKIKA